MWFFRRILENVTIPQSVTIDVYKRQILDRCESYNGNGGPLGAEVTAGLYRKKIYIETVNYIYGLGGRDFTTVEAKDVFAQLEDMIENGNIVDVYKRQG